MRRNALRGTGGLRANLSVAPDAHDRCLFPPAAPATWWRGCCPTSSRAVLGQSIVVENRAGASGAHRRAHGRHRDARRLHAAARPDRRNLDQPALAEGRRLRPRQGPAADRARVGRAAGAGRAGAKRLIRPWPDYRRLSEIRQAVSFASAGTGTPGHFAGETAQAGRQSQYDARALQGRRPRAQRSGRRPRRYVFPRLSGGDAAE